MSETETIDKLVDIIKRQADIIRALHGCLAQHTAAAALESEIAALQQETDNL